jgi:hypothetical protein
MPLWAEITLWVTGILFVLGVIVLIVLLGLLIREDMRTATAVDRRERDAEKADREERRQKVVEADAELYQTIFARGRANGYESVLATRIPRPRANHFIEQMEKNVAEDDAVIDLAHHAKHRKEA